MLGKADDITKSIQGNISKEQAQKMNLCLKHFDRIELIIAELESVILEHSTQFLKQIDLICTAPVIEAFSAIAIISEIGTDMSVFYSANPIDPFTNRPQISKRACRTLKEFLKVG